MKEEDAKNLVCPFLQTEITVVGALGHSNPDRECITKRCMFWKELHKETKDGFCGLQYDETA